MGFDPYYISILIFGFFSCYFSFGNIENARTLQVVTSILRFVITILMCLGSLFYIEKSGFHTTPIFNLKHQLKYLAQVFGNTTFVFIYHHSVSGIIYPVRPQRHIKKMFLYSNLIGTFFLATEALLAFFAFASLKNFCVPPPDQELSNVEFEQQFPCKVSGLYNENFLALPGIG